MTPELTAWQAAAECLRGCVFASRESLDERGWDEYLTFYFTLGAQLGRDRLLRELREREDT
ncbi:MAG TPA: hypothetical protein VHI53_14225 [Gaiellaceae bacterium]|jgi:hypothetical protein|nr:hypothetical protein [Gaiellaceae bacterium]